MPVTLRINQFLILHNNNCFCLIMIVTLPTIGQRTYIDPSNYDDPEAALKDFANEISPQSLFLERVLGGGNWRNFHAEVISFIAANIAKQDKCTC